MYIKENSGGCSLEAPMYQYYTIKFINFTLILIFYPYFWGFYQCKILDYQIPKYIYISDILKNMYFMEILTSTLEVPIYIYY